MAIKIIKGKRYSVASFVKTKAVADSIAKSIRQEKPLNKGDKKSVKVEKLDGGNYAVLVHAVYSKKTQNELANMFK